MFNFLIKGNIAADPEAFSNPPGGGQLHGVHCGVPTGAGTNIFKPSIKYFLVQDDLVCWAENLLVKVSRVEDSKILRKK